MFCPNCGNNCGNAKFCSECGTRLSCGLDMQKSHAPEQLTKLQARRFVNLPTTMGFSGKSGVLAFYDSAVSISIGSGKFKKRTYIPFEQLDTVIYMRPAYNGLGDGALLLRGGENRNVPIPLPRRMSLDDSAVTFLEDGDTLFYHIFQVLKAVAPSTARCYMILPDVKPKNINSIEQQVDMGYFWNEYAPFRRQATQKIEEMYHIKQRIAKILVDRTFDACQEERYKKDPLEAINDLNLLVGKTQNMHRLKAELKDVQKREEIERTISHISLLMLDKN